MYGKHLAVGAFGRVWAAKSAPDKLFDRGFLHRPAQQVDRAGYWARESPRRRVHASARPSCSSQMSPTDDPHGHVALPDDLSRVLGGSIWFVCIKAKLLEQRSSFLGAFMKRKSQKLSKFSLYQGRAPGAKELFPSRT